MFRQLNSFYYSRVLGVVQPWLRRRRMQQLSVLGLRRGDRVIDLGGTCAIWEFVEAPLEITIVNLPGVDVRRPQHTRHQFHFVAGDATALNYADDQFDLVFSNSVIEHL